ncbi:Beta-conglycinin, alpha' chain [Spatholobus suberectus]|nr:Beta-conglycinin, alpha' chain [Spatholobus suberectus]
MMRARFPLLLFLGIVFLASVSVSLGITHQERKKCLKSCESEKDPYLLQQCQIRCRHGPESRERGRQEGEKEEEKQEEEHEKEEEEWRGQHRREDPDERERVREREEEKREREKEEKRWQREKKEQQEEREEDEGSESESRSHKNPFHFSSKRFRTLFKNQHGRIRVLRRFDQRSIQLENLRHYRVLEFKSKPNTLLLPHHADADFILVVLSGTTFYLVNPDDNENLRVIKLAIPVNKPGKFQHFFLSSAEEQQSYLQGFSKNILEASFDTEFEEIQRVLFGEEQQKRGHSQEQGVIVEVSKELIRELSKHAKSSSRKTISSEDKPFNLRSRDPIYSNKFGKFFEITPEKKPQLRELDISLSSVDINEGALLLPHYNSKSTVILVVNEGEATIELVGLSEHQQQEEGTGEVRRYRAELVQDDAFTIPSASPVVVNATSNLNLFAFGINAENNERNFLAGEKDNVIRQIHRQVKELAFPGSAQDVEKLINNQKECHFADAQPQQKEEGKKERKGPLSSILGAFY